jgi:signal transduction histidine kinase
MPQLYDFSYGAVFADSLVVYEKINGKYKIFGKPYSWLNKPKPTDMRFPNYEIRFGALQQKEILIKLNNGEKPTIDLLFTIKGHQVFLEQQRNTNLFIGVFFGYCLCIVLVTFIFYLILRRRIILYYLITVLSTLLFQLANDGILRLYLPNVSPYFTSLYSISYYFTPFTIFFLLYMISYLNVKGPKIFYAWIIALVVIYALPVFNKHLFAEYWWYFTRFSLGWFMLPFFIYFLVLGFKTNRTFFWFLVVSILPITVTNIYYNLMTIGMFSYNPNLLFYRKASMMFEFILIAIGGAFQYFNTRQRNKQLKLSLIESQKEIIGIQDIERNRIGRDLHDEIGNGLAAIKNDILNKTEEKLLVKRVNDLLQTTRNISHNMASSDYEKLNLSTSVNDLFVRFNGFNATEYSLTKLGNERDISSDMKMHIFRIILECLGNIQKHAKAQKASVQLSFLENELLVIVEDDGVGFKLENEKSAGIGLKNIENRIALLNATISRESDTNGTVVAMNIPI